MAAPKTKTPQQSAALRAEIYTRYICGRSQYKIASELGISQQAVAAHIKKAREASRVMMESRRDERLAELTKIRDEAWAAWARSQQPAETTVTERIDGGSGEGAPRLKATVRREGQAGDASFLAQIQKAIEQERALLGLDAPKKAQISIDWPSLSDDQIARLAAGEDPSEVLAAPG